MMTANETLDQLDAIQLGRKALRALFAAHGVLFVQSPKENWGITPKQGASDQGFWDPPRLCPGGVGFQSVAPGNFPSEVPRTGNTQSGGELYIG
jgi:hypothetical protein